MIATPGEPNLPVPVPKTFHEQTDKELTENDIKRMDADDQAIQTILLGLLEDEKKAKLFNEWEKFTSTDRESIESYYPRFMQLMNDLKRNKHFLENIAANLKFLNNIQPEWKRHVTIVCQTKNFHEAYFTQIYDFIKMNQDEVNELRAERLTKTHDPLVLMAHSQNSYNFPVPHNDQSSSSTHSQQSFPINNKYNPQSSLNQNFMQPLMTSLEDINDPTEAMNAALILFAKAFQLIAPTNNNQRTSSNPRNQEFDFIVDAGDPDKIEEVNANCILMANLQHASTSSTQLDKAPVYDTDGSAEVNMVNCNMRATNAELKSELARYTIQEQSIEISQEKYDKLKKCYQKSVYQEQCLTRKINALHLSSAKQITTLNDEISNLNKQLSKGKSTISSFMEEKKRLKHDFKTREDKYLDTEVDLEAKIKDLENILLKRDQTVQTMHMLNPKLDLFYHPDQKIALGYPNLSYLKKAQLKQQSLYNGNLLLEEHDPPAVYDLEETLDLAQESREKMRFLKKEIKPANYAKINHLLGVFVPQRTNLRKSYFYQTFLTWSPFSKRFLHQIKIFQMTLLQVLHEKVHKIISHEITPIVNQVDAMVQNFEIQFLQEPAKFVRDFKSLAKEADESLDKQKSLELETERLLKASVSHDIMYIVQNGFVDVPSDLQIKLDRTKEKLKHCIIKKEKEYVVLWNNWYIICEECKYDMISYDKAYNDLQQKVERLQAQLINLKGKSSDSPSASNTLDPLN
nr:hypothetical protein [Tanacetum cinerariifolium]